MKLNAKQKKAIQLLADATKSFFLLYGAARSGKTALICRYFILTAIKYPGVRLMIGRYRFNHAKLSVWMQTLMPMVKQMLPSTAYYENRTDWILQINVDGKTSEIWLAGFDEKERAEKVLSMEFARIAIIEMFQISYDVFEILKTRLNTDIKNIRTQLIGDGNPRGKRHWIYRAFILGVDAKTATPMRNKDRYAYLKFLVEDNKENLSAGYIENNLESLTGVMRARLRYGDFADQTEGAVFRFDRSINHVDTPFEYDPALQTWCGWDFGIASDQFLVWFQIAPIPKTKENPLGFEVRIIDEYVNNNKDYVHYVNIVKKKPYRDVRHAGDPAGRQRGARLDSWFSLLESQGIPLQSPSGKYSVADMVDNINTMIKAIRICESQCPDMTDAIENWAYPTDKDGQIKEGVLPEHNKFSHPCTAFYYAFACAFPPRRENISFD